MRFNTGWQGISWKTDRLITAPARKVSRQKETSQVTNTVKWYRYCIIPQIDICNQNHLIIVTDIWLYRQISPPHGGQVAATGNRRFRSRSPQSRGARLRGRSPDRFGRLSPERARRRSFSRSRSRSPTYGRSRVQMSPDPPGYVPTKAQRCRDYDEKGIMDLTYHFNITNSSLKTNWEFLSSILFRHQLKQVDI